MAMANASAEPELQHAGGKTHDSDGCKYPSRGGAEPKAANAHHDGKGQRDGPKVKGEVLDASDGAEKGGGDGAYDEGEGKGTNEKRKDSADNEDKTCPKSERAGRVGCRCGRSCKRRAVRKKGDNGGNEKRDDKIDEYGVTCEAFHISAELARDDCSSRCRGTDETKHGALNDGTAGANCFATDNDNHCKGNEGACLKQEMAEVPRPQMESAGVDFAERDEEHCKDEPGLDELDGLKNARFVGLDRREKDEGAVK